MEFGVQGLRASGLRVLRASGLYYNPGHDVHLCNLKPCSPDLKIIWVYCFGLRFSVLRLRALGFRALGLELWVSGLGFRFRALGLRV